MCAGLDEVGMGALAGPICTTVVIFPTNAEPIEGVGDSKQLSASKRAELAPVIMKEASFFGIGWAHPSVIDEKGVEEAWRRACLDALEGAPAVDILMIDGNKHLHGFAGEQEGIAQGDAKVWQIGAASIIAKVVRDLEMAGMSKHFQAYQWEKNKGYGSRKHLEALFQLGPTFYHRGLFLKKIWLRFGEHINKELASWKEWEEAWKNGPDELEGWGADPV